MSVSSTTPRIFYTGNASTKVFPFNFEILKTTDLEVYVDSTLKTIGTPATATATISGGAVTGLTLGVGGTSYTTAPTIVLSGGGGSSATAICTQSGGAVNSFTVTAGGSGYSTSPTVVFSAGGTAYEINDTTDDTSSTGNITFRTAPGSGEKVSVYSNRTPERTSDFADGATLRANVLNREIDNVTITSRDNKSFRDQAVRLDLFDSGSFEANGDLAVSLTIPVKADRASKYLSFDSDGNVTASVTASAMDDLSDVNITSPSDASVLLYDTGTSTWRDAQLSGGVSISDTGAVTIASSTITSDMLNDNLISGQGALTSGLATTDELLISDGGTLKKMDVSVLTTYNASLSETLTNKTIQLGGNLDVNGQIITASSGTIKSDKYEEKYTQGGLVLTDMAQGAFETVSGANYSMLYGPGVHAESASAWSYPTVSLKTRSANAYPNIWAMRSQDDSGDPDFLNDSDIIFTFFGAGWDGTSPGSPWNTKHGSFEIRASENHDASAQGGKLLFYTTNTGTKTSTEKLLIDDNVHINSGKLDIDVRVDGDSVDNLLFVNANTDRVGIKTNNPSYDLDVAGTFRASAVWGSSGEVTPITNANLSGLSDGQYLRYVAAESIFKPTSVAVTDIVGDTSPQLGGALDTNGQQIVSTSNQAIEIKPNGTGDVHLGNFVFDADQTGIGSGTDNYIFAYDHSSGKIVLEENEFVDATVTLTNKSIDLGTNTLTGSLVEFNAALQSDAFVSLTGTETLTNKTLTSPKINENVEVTATASELNILDGVTSTTAELNILDGVTSTMAELNLLDGVTSTTAELNIVDGVTSTTAELNLMDGGTSAGTTAVASGDGIVTNDGGTMRQTTLATFDTYLSASTKTLTNKSIDMANNALTGDMDAFNTALQGDAFVSLTRTETLTNKTLTTPVITSISNSGTVTIPTGAETLVGRATTDTLTNKTLTTPIITEIDSGSTITLDATADITLDAGGNDILLKTNGTQFGILHNDSNQLWIYAGSGLPVKFTDGDTELTGDVTISGDVDIAEDKVITFEGATSNAYETTLTVVDPTADRTVSLPNATDTLVGKATTDTLTNKTLTSPKINEDVVVGATATELNLLDGSAKSTSSITIADTDAFIVIDGTTTKQIPATDLAGYTGTVTLTGTQTLTNKTLTAPKFAGGGKIIDENANEQIVFQETDSAVNHIQITNGASGQGPSILAIGDDTNINLDLSGKGTGTVVIADELQVNGSITGVTGTVTLDNALSVPNGGTGATTFTDNSLIKGDGASNLQSLSNLKIIDSDKAIHHSGGGGIIITNLGQGVYNDLGGAAAGMLYNTGIHIEGNGTWEYPSVVLKNNSANGYNVLWAAKARPTSGDFTDDTYIEENDILFRFFGAPYQDDGQGYSYASATVDMYATEDHDLDNNGGGIKFKTLNTGVKAANGAETEKIRITNDVTINSGSLDIDFMVNGDSVANALKVDAGTDTLSSACVKINFANLPTSDPGVAGQLWRSTNDLKVSTG